MALNKTQTQLRYEIEKEILAKADEDTDIKRQAKENAENIRDYAKELALREMNRGYATGKFVESIKIRRIKRWFRKTMPNYELFSDDPIANLLEHGTNSDAPGGHATWIGLDGERHFGPNTPTPAYNTFAKTAFHFRGTPDEEE